MQAVIKISRDSNELITFSQKRMTLRKKRQQYDTLWIGIKRYMH